MEHIDKDKLYKYSLQLLDDSENEVLKAHLDNCEICSEKKDRIAQEINMIGSFDPDLEMQMPILKKKFKRMDWIKSAAVLLIGFFFGYSVSISFHKDPVLIVGQQLKPISNISDTTLFTICPNVDIYP